MPSLFGIDIAGIVNAELGPGLLPATLQVVTPGSRDPLNVTSGTNPTVVEYSCRGVLEDYDDRQIDGELILRGDRKVLLLGKSIGGGAVEPKPGDQVTIEGRTFSVIGVTRDPAAATYTLQVRG